MSKKPEPSKDQAAKIAGDVLRMARILVAAGYADSVTQLLSDICRPALVKMMKQARDSGGLDPAQVDDD